MKNIKFVEDQIRMIILENKVTPAELLIAVHNVCAHGELWPRLNFGKKDCYLGQMFDGFDISIAGAEKVKKKIHRA